MEDIYTWEWGKDRQVYVGLFDDHREGEGKKNGRGDGKSRKRKHPDSDDLPKICRYQEKCHRNCTFAHLDEEYLGGCKRPEP